MDIPPGWEKKGDPFGHSYFVDHARRSTTFIDPRLPTEESTTSRQRHRAEVNNFYFNSLIVDFKHLEPKSLCILNISLNLESKSWCRELGIEFILLCAFL